MKLSLIILLVAAALAATISAALPTTGSVKWGPCGGDSLAHLDCGTLEVPMNWDNPSGPKISLSMNRVKTNAKRKIGTIFFNPGGPGEPAIHTCARQAKDSGSFGKKLTDYFDILCLDVRGVGQSTPMKCDDELIAKRNSLKFVIGIASFREVTAANAAIGHSCLEMSGDLPRYMDSVSVAKDMEAIRASLGEKFNFLGISYGTVLGSTYAELFPQNVRSMVLDAVVDHGMSVTDAIISQAANHEDVLNQFFVWCKADRRKCGFNVKDPARGFDLLVDKAESASIPAPKCNGRAACPSMLSGHAIQRVVIQRLYWERTFHTLGQALEQAMFHNDASSLLDSPSSSMSSAAHQASLCLDWGSPYAGYEDIRQVWIAATASTPHTGHHIVRDSIAAGCAGWPIEASNSPRPFDSEALSKAPPILIVNARHDVATAYQWAESLRAQLPGSFMISREGIGHGSYFKHGGAAELIEKYFLDLGIAKDNIVYS